MVHARHARFADTADSSADGTLRSSWITPKAVDLAQIAKLLVHNQTPVQMHKTMRLLSVCSRQTHSGVHIASITSDQTGTSGSYLMTNSGSNSRSSTLHPASLKDSKPYLRSHCQR